MKDKNLKRILDNITLKSVKYQGIKWKIGDTFYHKYDGKDIEDHIQSIQIINYDSTVYETELRLSGEIYACNIEECYKLNKKK